MIENKYYIRVYFPDVSMWLASKVAGNLTPNDTDACYWTHTRISTVNSLVCEAVFSGIERAVNSLKDTPKHIEVAFYDGHDMCDKDEPYFDADNSFGALRITMFTKLDVVCDPKDPRGGFIEQFGKVLSGHLAMLGIESLAKSLTAKLMPDSMLASLAYDDKGTTMSTDSVDLEKLIQEVTQSTKADITKPKETLEDYICTPELKEELIEIADIFKNEKTYSEIGVTLPKGVLLKGTPGTGKTYAARCIAGTTDAIFMSCTASALQGQYIGSGAENIRMVFRGARALREKSRKPVILFLDELDSFGTRERRGSSGDEENRTLNQLLAEMSGFENASGILILGATNYPDRLDPAAMRSGRFSRQITIEVPEEDARKNLLDFYFKKIKMKRVAGADDLANLAAITKGFTPADIAELANETALLALRKKKRELDLSTVNEAIDRIITKETRMASKPADWQVSVHEAGHVLAEYLYQGTVSLKVTNFQYGSAGGFTQPNSDTQFLMSKKLYYANIRTLLAGRAAEQVVCSDISVGASDDLNRAKKMAEDAICRYNFQPRTAEDMELQVQALLNAEYDTVVKDFKTDENREILDRISKQLMSDRVLYTPQLVACGLCPKEF